MKDGGSIDLQDSKHHVLVTLFYTVSNFFQ